MVLSEKTIEKEVVFEGRIITVRKDKAELGDGSIAPRELVIHSGGVCVVPLTDDNKVIMVRQFRYAFGEPLLEIPAGKLEKGEEHRSAALRELEEETGAKCTSFEYLGVCYPSVAYLTEKIHMYLARGLSFGKAHLDEGEFLDVIRVPLDEAVEMVMRGEIPDAKTQIALLKTKMIIDSGK
ncbi:MAG: NUDIX hydrolase [Oscillospiraceae bacterium]|nr:NUDIX hydrolase [Oscillospiraceae bacterium]MDD7278475.1 NUDIX hydrolase [Oscillospiraceae bacterium]MDY2863278.1 NUDIX hydrolase [Oscillospiraceae bacterium]